MRPAVSLSGTDGEAPPVVSADQHVALKPALAQESPLMRAEALEGAPSRTGAHQGDIDAPGRKREGPGAFEFAQSGQSNERFGFHKMSSGSK